ncbi:putative bifunctional diguanylate cyclase/phosphodiesterase [Tepidibacter sp. Z1-5]|uniref:putative bifunctional diguanylate cyclase/phosphodiesterase n=1 Tax=Tepidibacter sp. Z1-5 TaxID=3134138 RepID=UPI0030C040D1
MGKLKNIFNKIVCKYTFVGMLFGLSFPMSAIVFEIIRLNLNFKLQNIIYIHHQNKLLFMIDTAPFFLGSFASIAGVIRGKLELRNMELKNQTIIDELTKVYNRRYGKERIKNCIHIAKENNTKIGVILIDLDRFKMVNDTLGHTAGDQLLKKIGKMFIDELKMRENIIRLGGDEFLIIVNEVKKTKDINEIIGKIIRSFESPIKIDERLIHIKASMGISIFPDHGQDMETLLKKADIAMYRCKKHKRKFYEFYDECMLESLNEKFLIENELNHAIEKKELFLVYQPIVHANTGEILGAEALLRWNNTTLGMVSPNKFIPIAEKANLISAIGKWVLEEACRQNKYWQDRGFCIVINVNVSVNQFKEENFVDQVKKILEETGLEAKHLKIEITESISMENIPNIQEIFNMFRKIGVKVAIDDFGTGYSSFAQLKSLFIDTLKIDKSFIGGIHVDINNTSIVSAMVALAKELDLNIVAEGVETIEQLTFLKEQECNQIQGYLYSKPVKSNVFEELLKKGFLLCENEGVFSD